MRRQSKNAMGHLPAHFCFLFHSTPLDPALEKHDKAVTVVEHVPASSIGAVGKDVIFLDTERCSGSADFFASLAASMTKAKTRNGTAEDDVDDSNLIQTITSSQSILIAGGLLVLFALCCIRKGLGRAPTSRSRRCADNSSSSLFDGLEQKNSGGGGAQYNKYSGVLSLHSRSTTISRFGDAAQLKTGAGVQPVQWGREGTAA